LTSGTQDTVPPHSPAPFVEPLVGRNSVQRLWAGLHLSALFFLFWFKKTHISRTAAHLLAMKHTNRVQVARELHPFKHGELVMAKMWSQSKCDLTRHDPIGVSPWNCRFIHDQTDMISFSRDSSLPFLAMSSPGLFQIFHLCPWSIRSELKKDPPNPFAVF